MGKQREPAPEKKRDSNEWMATFADLVTLLLTFFVLFLTMSSLDSKVLITSFGFFDGALGALARAQAELTFSAPNFSRSIVPPARVNTTSTGVLSSVSGDLAQFLEDQGDGSVFETRYILEPGQGGGAEKVPDILRDNELLLRALASGFELTLRPEFKRVLAILNQKSPDSIIEVEMIHGNLRIKCSADLVFVKGKAMIRRASIGVLKEIATLIKETPKQIRARIIGYASEEPLTEEINDKWDLAVARSANVVGYLTEIENIPRDKLSISGYAVDESDVKGDYVIFEFIHPIL